MSIGQLQVAAPTISHSDSTYFAIGIVGRD